MWDLIAISACLIGLAATLSRFREIDDGPVRLLLLGLWLRYAMQAFPYVVTSIRIGPFSLIAVISIATALLFLIFLNHRLLRLRALLPVYAVLAVSLLSGVVNSEPMGIANDFIKWGYFIGVMLLSYRAMTLYGSDRALRALLVTLLTPSLLFVASVAVGNAKATELDGSVSYIGGYFHESMFSSIMYSVFALGCLVRWRSVVSLAFILGFGVVAILMVNYRSAVVALAPALLALAAIAFLRGVGPRFAVGATVALAVPVLGGLPFLLDALPDRYAEITHFTNNVIVLSKDPIELTSSERALFSYRVAIWVEYLYSARQGDLVNNILGYGPNAHENLFRLIPHNTFISAFWEFGIIGVVTSIFMAMYYIFLPLWIDDIYDRLFLSALMLGVVVNGLASMPLWTIEGLIIYAQLAAYAAWRVSGNAKRGQAPQRVGVTGPAQPA